MGMTIEESKRNLSYAIKWKDRPTDESMVLAIDVMNKYQKIQEIVENSNGLFDGSLEHNKAFVKICEVIEDGNK